MSFILLQMMMVVLLMIYQQTLAQWEKEIQLLNSFHLIWTPMSVNNVTNEVNGIISEHHIQI